MFQACVLVWPPLDIASSYFRPEIIRKPSMFTTFLALAHRQHIRFLAGPQVKSQGVSWVKIRGTALL